MPIRFTQGDVAFLLRKLGMSPARKGSSVYAGIEPDGVFRRCMYHYHSDQTPVATGTAGVIARVLGLTNAEGMKSYLDNQGWKRR